jgi:hypothetical protein
VDSNNNPQDAAWFWEQNPTATVEEFFAEFLPILARTFGDNSEQYDGWGDPYGDDADDSE